MKEGPALRMERATKSRIAMTASRRLVVLAVSSVATLAALVLAPTHPARRWADLLGSPLVALLVAVLFSFYSFGWAVDFRRQDILKFMDGKIAKWWMPDDVAFVEEIPHTATGKILKTELRERFKDYRLPTAAA